MEKSRTKRVGVGGGGGAGLRPTAETRALCDAMTPTRTARQSRKRRNKQTTTTTTTTTTSTKRKEPSLCVLHKNGRAIDEVKFIGRLII